MNTAPEVKTLGSTVERLKTNRNELAELCSDIVTFAGVALPVRIMTDLLESYLCDEDRTPEQIKEVTTIMTNHIAFIVSLGENDHELKLLDSLLKIESLNLKIKTLN